MKEDNIINRYDNIVDQIEKKEILSVDKEDYLQLGSEYKKLVKRYNKILKINDSINSHVFHQNKELQDDKQKIIKASREKILSNMASQRHQQEKYSNNFTDQKKLADQLKED